MLLSILGSFPAWLPQAMKCSFLEIQFAPYSVLDNFLFGYLFIHLIYMAATSQSDFSS